MAATKSGAPAAPRKQGATAFCVAGRDDAEELLADLSTFAALDNALIGARMH
jgi:hypothetical protein